MPILYDEGQENAFYRLQVEIFQATGDYSLLAWQFNPVEYVYTISNTTTGLDTGNIPALVKDMF